MKNYIYNTATFIGALIVGGSAYAAVTVGSAQFHAKLYSEALGRIPDQSGWSGAMSYYQNQACNTAALKGQGISVLTSAEFTNLVTSNNERIFKLHRAALHRDPTAAEFSNLQSLLGSGATWSSVVQSVFNGTEFSGRTAVNCGATPFGWQPTQPFNVVSTSTGSFAGGTGAQLQALIDKTPAGGTVYLEQGAIVKIDTTLYLRNGRTLTTIGAPGKNHSGLLGRLVRNSPNDSQLIELEANSTLKNVWVDGQRNRFGSVRQGINLLSRGSNISIINNLITDSPGWTSSQSFGSGEGVSCTAGYIGGNLVTVYGSSHTIKDQWTDGISVACENMIVEYNEIIDATDVSIVLYRSSPAIQKSIARFNTALNAGNSAYGGYVADPLLYGNGTLSHNFAGAKFQNNTIWSSPVAHVDIVLSNGTRAWFGTASDMGYGASFDGNTSGSQKVRGSIGIAVSGMKEAYVQGNILLFEQTPSRCPSVNVGASVSTGYASGNLQSYTDILIQGCIGH